METAQRRPRYEGARRAQAFAVELALLLALMALACRSSSSGSVGGGRGGAGGRGGMAAGTGGVGGSAGSAAGGSAAGTGGSAVGTAGSAMGTGGNAMGTAGSAAGTGGSAGGTSGRGGSAGTGGRGGAAAGGRGGSAGGGTTGGSTVTGGRGGTAAGGRGGTTGTGGAGLGLLRVDPVNKRYFTDGSKVIYLTGSHTWGNFKDRATRDPPPAFDFAGYLAFLTAHNHNFIRLWTWEQPHGWDISPDYMLYFQPWPWPRSGPGNASDGKPKFDLSKFDQAFFDRLRARVVAAAASRVYVSIMLFDGWDLANAYNATDGGFPYASGNNVNGMAITGADAFSLSNTAVTTLQEAFVRKVIDSVNDLDNVLYEIANETGSGAVAWQTHMIGVVRSYEAGLPKQHPIGMTSTYPGSDADLYASSADWISPNTRLAPGDGRKVVINDTDHSYYYTDLNADGPAAQRAWVWKTLTIGASPLFMDPYLETIAGRNAPAGTTPDATWETIRAALGRSRSYADRLDLQHAVPSASLSSTGYCLANPGTQYLVYQPGSGAFMLTLAAATYSYEWYNPASGVVAETGSLTAAAGARSFTPPFSGDAVLLLSR